MKLRLFSVFLLSGAAGLIYEVLWVRQFGNLFGNTTATASLVVAIFMCGLGAGSVLAGWVADSRYATDPVAPLRLYGQVELSIAGVAALSAVALPALAEASGTISSYVTGAHGWHFLSTGSWALRALLATALLLPATTLMGATLTLLIRFVVAGDVGAAGLRVGQLYAVNTLGAAVGAFLTDRVLVPALGLFSSQLLAVSLNLIAGLLALRLARRGPIPSPTVPLVGAAAETPPLAALAPLLLTSTAVLLAGFASLGMEMVWLRHLASMLGGYRSVFSLCLTVILLGIVAGSALGGLLVERTRRPVELFLSAQGLFVVATLGALALGRREVVSLQLLQHLEAYRQLAPWQQGFWQLWLEMKPMLLLVGLPSVVMGATFPLANACVQKVAPSVGRQAGVLYLANTVGGVLGTLLTGFVLLPTLGSQQAVLALAAVVGVGLLPMALSDGERVRGTRWVALGASAGAVLLSVGLWSRLEPQFLLSKGLLKVQRGKAQLLTAREGTNEAVAVLESGGVRSLFTDGHSMSGSAEASQRYMRLFAHLPLLLQDAPKSVLVICFGVGNTLHAASLHPSVTRLEVSDLSQNVLEHAGWFEAASNHGALADPRTAVFINDGRQHLRMVPEGSYDLITLEPPPISFAGVSALYSKEFYRLARSRLTPGGYMTQWLPAYQVKEEAVRELVRAFVEVFPSAVLLSGNGKELVLLGTSLPQLRFDPERVAAALRARPAVQADLAQHSLGTLTEQVGTFLAGPRALAAATEAVEPLTDDRPTLEYSVLSDATETRFPPELVDVADVASFCPGCFANGQAVQSLKDLPTYLTVMRAYYQSELFLETSNLQPASTRPAVRLELPAGARTLIQSSPYLQTFLGPPSQP